MLDSLQTSTDVPPAWSSRLEEYFRELKTWINESAYPALINGPLKSDVVVTSLPSEVAKAELALADRKPIPIALVGVTGIGKSTLLNAVLDEDFLPTGFIGSQTAAFVTIRYAPEWEITCEYISRADLERIFADAASEVNDETETGSLELKQNAERKIRALYELKDDAQLPSREELLSGPPESLLDIVASGQVRYLNPAERKKELDLHAKGRYWPITRSIDVRGPLEMLRSGVVISDLPGAGDLNRARVLQASSAIAEAGQLLIAAGPRLLDATLMDQLAQVARVPHRIFRTNEPLQIVLVGTSIDKVPDPEDDPGEVQQLGLDPSQATLKDVFHAVCSTWEQRIRQQFAEWLRVQAQQFLSDLPEPERQVRLERVMANVTVVSTSAKDWNLQRRGKPMKVCRDATGTGIPSLRACINSLAHEQIKTTANALERQIATLRDTALAAIQRSELALGADIEAILSAIERSSDNMMEVQERHVKIVEDLRMSVLDRFHSISELLNAKIETASQKMRDIGRRQVETDLFDLHWKSLRASVERDGFWRTSSGRTVSLRDTMGGEVVRLVPQAWSRLADDRLGNEMVRARDEAIKAVADFTAEISRSIQRELDDSLSLNAVTSLLQAGRESAEVRIERAAQKVTDELKKTSQEMQQRVDAAIDESIAEICSAASEDNGTGWKVRSLNRVLNAISAVAEDAQKRCTRIADDVFAKLEKHVSSFCNTAVEQMAKMGESVPQVFHEAIERSKLTTPQTQKLSLDSSRRSAPAALVVN